MADASTRPTPRRRGRWAALTVIALAALIAGGTLAAGAGGVTAHDANATTAPNETVTIAPTVGAPANATLNLTVSDPANGTATVNGSTIVYDPAANFTGTDRFEYTASTSNGSDSGRITVVVNAAPVANNDSRMVTDEHRLNGSLPATDPDGDDLTYSIVDNVSHGTLDVNVSTGEYTYTPNLNFPGVDSFRYAVSDGTNSDTATVEIDVAVADDPPVASPTTETVSEDGRLNASLNASDQESDQLDYSIVSEPTNGTVDLNASTGEYTYTPDPNFNGEDSFRYAVHDKYSTDNATVTITVEPVNDPPVARDVTLTATEDNSTTAAFNVSDPDDDALNVDILDRPSNGTVSVNGTNVTYTPTTETERTDGFTYRVTDGKANARARVNITIDLVNDAPVARSISLTATEGESTTASVNVSDPDDSTLSVAILSKPTNGNVTVEGTNVTYTPATETDRADVFAYRVTDGEVNDTATVGVTIELVNDRPTAANLSLSTVENTSIMGTVEVHDIDDENLTVTAANATHGTVSVDGLNLTYRPDPGYSGTDTFAYTVSDGNLTESATVTVTVAPNDAPVVHDAVHLTTGNGTLRVPVNATDPDGDALTYTVVENASNGSARLENGTLIYDADSTFEGIDAVTVAVSDGIETTRATIQIAVDRPTLSRLKTRTVSVRPGGAVAVDLLDGGQSNRSIEMVAAPDRGTIDPPSDAGVVEYRPPTNATETWSSVYRVATSEGSEIRIVHFAVVRDDTPPTVRSVAVLNPMPNWIDITLETDQALRTATAVVENSSGTIVKRVSLARVTGSPVETAFVYREATALPNGTYRIRVTATDYDGERQTAARTVTIDGSGPRIASSQFDASIESGRTLRISGSANVTGSNVSGVSAWVPGVGMDPVALTQIAPDRWVLNDSAIQITTTAPPRNGMVVIDARGDTGRTIQLATTWYAADRHPSTLSLSATATGDTIRVRVDHSEPLTRLRVRVAGPETRTTETLRYDGTMTALASFENLTSGTYTVAVLDATDHGGNTPADLPTTTVRVGPAEEGPVATSSGGGSLFGSGFDIATPTTTASGGAIRTPVEQTTTTPSTTTTTGFSTAPSTSRETTTTLEVHQKNPSDGSGPGFGAVTALVAVLAAVGLWTRTR